MKIALAHDYLNEAAILRSGELRKGKEEHRCVLR